MILPKLLPCHMMRDVASILGCLEFVMGRCDRQIAGPAKTDRCKQQA
ncbi:MAG: hypothetical protein ABIP20_03295 [Chthoniobacteraceae bacterium]